MKKSLAILLTLILTFNCFSILGIGSVSAETNLAGDNFENWFYNAGNLNLKDENSDGTMDYVRISSTVKKSNVAVATAPFELVPNNEYELSFYLRIPEASNSFIVNGEFKSPEVIIYEPTVDTDTGKVTDVGKLSGTESENNYYVYKYGSTWMRRSGFIANWTVAGYETVEVRNYSHFAPSSQKTLFGETTDVKEVYKNWTKITAKFTAVADEDGETSQTAAVCFNIKDIGKLDGYCFDVKDVKLVNRTLEPEVPALRGPEVFEGFEDFAAGTKLYDANLNGMQNMFVYTSKAAQAVKHYDLTVTDEMSHEGTKSLMGKTYFQYAAMPLNLTPNTKYELSFWYTYSTTDADRYLREITYGIYSPVEGTSFSKLVIDGAGTRRKTETFEPDNSIPGEWIKGTVDFETGDNVDNIVFAYTYHDRLKSDSSATVTVNKCPLYIDNVSIMPVTEEEPTPDPEPEVPDEPEPKPEVMDFEDVTKWGLNGYKSTQLAGYEGHVLPEDYMRVEENTDSAYILDGDSSIRLSTQSRWYDYKLTGLKSNTKYALKFSYLVKGPKKPESAIDKNIFTVYGIFNYAESNAKLSTGVASGNPLGFLNYVNTSSYAVLDNDGEGTKPDYYKNGVRAITTKQEADVWYTATLYFNTSVVKDTLALVINTNCSNTYLDKFQLVEVDYTNPMQDVNAPQISGKTQKGPFETENTTSYLYEDCSSDDYEAYLATLKNSEFVEYATNAYGNNKFATYTKGNTTVTVTYTPNNGTILVTDQATDTLPTTKEQNAYEDKGLQPLIIQLDHNNKTNGGIGMSYIIRLADGSFIIVDGGHTETYFDNATRLYKLLREYTPEGKIQIAAWLITHCHSDHIGGFISFVERYSNEADIEQVIYNAATYDQFKANADASSKATQKEAILPSYINQDAFTATIALLRLNGTKISTCHSGYVYNIRNAVINVMFTLEDVFPKVFSVEHFDANNTTSVFKISFTDENVDQTLLITGDSANVECDALYAKYTGDELKSTFVQAIHHAIACGSYELYAKMAPEVILLPAGYSRISSQLYQAQNQYFIDENSTVKEVVLSDYGTRTFALPYTAPEGLTGLGRFTLPDDIENVNSLDVYHGVSIRKAEGETKQALRFKFGMPEQVIRSQTESGYKVVEYGAMVSEDSAKLSYYEGSKPCVTENGLRTYKAVSYNKDENKNIVFDYTNYANYNDGIHRTTNFTCALNNIGVDKFGKTDYSKYDTTYYVRSYIVFENENGDTKIYYGATQSASVFATMQAVLKSTETDDQTASDKEYVKNFLDGKVAGFIADAAAIKEAWIKDSARALLYTPAN